MLLNFYIYEYSQDLLVNDLELGTRFHPNNLQYTRVQDVVMVIKDNSSKEITVMMIQNPHWGNFVAEIRENRPVISIVPCHGRTFTGSLWSRISIQAHQHFRGLPVYDPWVQNAGVITRWENLNTKTYQYLASVRKEAELLFSRGITGTF